MEEVKNTTINERLEAIARKNGLKLSEFQRRIGVSQSYVRNSVDSVSEKVLNRIIKEFPSINPMWVLTGEGEMITPATSSSSVVFGDVASGNNIGSSNAELLEFYKKELDRLKELYDNALLENSRLNARIETLTDKLIGL